VILDSMKTEAVGLGRVLLEINYINLQRALRTSTYDFAPIRVLIGDLRFRIQMSFTDATVIYTP
jgi:hypothetical protein